jgi:hypothetical protein
MFSLYLQPVFQPYFPELQKVYARPKPELRSATHIFKVTLAEWQGGDGSIWRRIAVPPNLSLDALAGAILHAYKFDDDHLYDFRYRDVGYLWGIALQIGFWLTPIIYLDLMVPPKWRWIVWVNPVGRIIGDSRRALIYGWWPGARGLAITTAMSIGIYVYGRWVFHRRQHKLVEHF